MAPNAHAAPSPSSSAGTLSDRPLDVVVIGLGNMGRSHALAYHRDPRFRIVALVSRSVPTLPDELAHYPLLHTAERAIDELDTDVVSINTYSDTHAALAIRALQRGRHVFLEKPMATTVADAMRVVAVAEASGRKLVIGYILRHHPSWQRLIEEARALGGPFVFRMNLNQQSSGDAWSTHKALLDSLSPIVDCGVHYVDVMCQITDSLPVKVSGMGLRLADDIAAEQINYGHFQVHFADGSIGWYEAGWGPMMSETAFFVKDVISPNGAVSIVMDEGVKSADIDSHTRTSRIRVHHAEVDGAGAFRRPDTLLDMRDEPDHQALCDAEQAWLHRAIIEDIDLTRHWRDAVQSLKVCLAADESVRLGDTVRL